MSNQKESSKTRSRRLGAFLAYVLVVALFLFVYLQAYVYRIAQIIDPFTISMYTGIIAYVVFLTQFLLAGRIRLLERVIGQDSLLRIHGFLGISLAVLIALHGIIKLVIFGPSIQTVFGSLAVVIYLFLAPAAILVLQGRAARKAESPPYEKTKIRHNFFLAAAVLVVIHVQLASSTYSIATRILTIGWAILSLGAYFNHKYLRPRRAARYRVRSVEDRGDDVVTLVLEPVPPGTSGTDRIPARRPGQFAYFTIEAEGIPREEHPFTIAGAPDEPVQMIIRKNGDFTRTLSAVPEGAPVAVDGPYGHFTPPAGDGMRGLPLYLLAGGIGITPMLSMVRDERTRERHPITLAWSVRSESDLRSAPEIDAYRNEITFVPVVSEYGVANASGSGTGRFMDRPMLETIITIAHRQAAEFYVCGPPGFLTSVTASLRAMGIGRRNIHSERFSWR